VAAVLIYLPLVIPALAGLAARPLAARLEPCQATWLLTAAAVALAACSTAALALLAAFAAARAPALAALGDYSARVIRRGDPVPATAGVLAGLALAGAVLAVAVISRNWVRALAESYRRAARLRADDSVVVVPGPAIQAYALPGKPGRIVVSGRLLARLDAGGQAVLIAHEQAHLAGRHHLFAAAARLAAAANPLLLPVARSVEFTVERWADEHAAAVTGDRRLVAETIGQVALLATARCREPGITLGITGPFARRKPWIIRGVTGPFARRVAMPWAGPVPRRVAALLSGPPRRRTVLLAAFAAIALLAGTAALEAARDLHALVELAQVGQ
jgi:Zn-dependent protease with chaperone function